MSFCKRSGTKPKLLDDDNRKEKLQDLASNNLAVEDNHLCREIFDPQDKSDTFNNSTEACA